MQDLYLKSVYRFLLVFLSVYVTRLIDRRLERDDWWQKLQVSVRRGEKSDLCSNKISVWQILSTS
jgi:hypothetical protein